MAEILVLITVLCVTAGFVALAYRWPGPALIASLAVSVAGAAVAAMVDYRGPGSIPLVIFLGTLVAVCLLRGSPDADGWPQAVAKWTLIVLVASSVAVAMIGTGTFLAPVGLAILGGVILRLILLSRRAVTHYVISTISACMRQHIPLTSGLAAAIEGRTGKRARILGCVHALLLQGQPLSRALRYAHRACPGDVIATIEVAERMDQLPQALRGLEADMLSHGREQRHLKPCPTWYPLAVLFVVVMLLSFTAVWIIPAYERILREMGRPLPGATRSVLDAFFLLRVLMPLVALAALVAVPVGLYVKFRPRRADRFQLLARMGDFFKWHVPIGRWFERNRSMLRTVNVLRLSLEAGCTLDEAIAATAELDLNCYFRKQLRRWLSRVREGEHVAQAARASGLGRSLAWAFDQHANPRNTPGALETLETICRSNYSYRAKLARFIGWPMIILALAATVGYVVYALYLPVFEMNRFAVEALLP